MGKLNDRIAHDANYDTLPQRSSQPKISSDQPGQISPDSHEDHQALHLDSIERAAVTQEEEHFPDGTWSRRANRLVTNTQLEDVILEMKERILALERQVAAASNSEEPKGFVGSSSAIDPLREGKTICENSVQDRFDQQQILPQIHGKSWSDFMNKHTDEKEEYAIEVLLGEPSYYQPSKENDRTDRKEGKNRHLRPELEAHGMHHDSTTYKQSDEATAVPERIRINSRLILDVLEDINKQIDSSGSIVMLRPFKFLVHYETKIRDSVRALEIQLKSTGNILDPDQSAESTTSEPSRTSGASQISHETENRKQTLQHMLCLVEFIDRYVKPTMDRLNNASEGKVRFQDLWFLFSPGTTIYMPIRLPQAGPISLDAVTTSPEVFQSRYNMMWRVTGIGGGRPQLSVTQNQNAHLEINPFKINCFYIDFDGKTFGPTTHSFSIMPFKGEQEITSLKFFPMRFLKDAQHTVKGHLDRAKKIYDHIGKFTHFYYAGPTLLVQPCGCSFQNEYPHQEHVESEVIVDFRTTLMKNPTWRPKPVHWKNPPIEPGELEERHPVRYWNDMGRTKLQSTDQIYNDYDIDEETSANFRNNESIFRPGSSDWLSNESMVPEKDTMLLPGRVFAFVLRTRTFAPLCLLFLQPIRPQVEGFHNLQLRDDTFKHTVQALVRTHFIQKNAQQASDFEYDVVRGKGKGLVILLHGAPGVGKTFTAESVAAANGKPLFQITVGALGLTPGEVEKALKEIFHFAQLWSCVLLLDECDIFLTQRAKNDIKRNSLVSVFSRVLEFYTGVLFLTTNRVGVLDDAVQSRITWIAYYPPLDETQTKKIWKTNIKLLERNKRHQVDKINIMRFAEEHFKSAVAKKCTWNGRQIQNAFKVATALAEWDAYSEDVQHKIDTRVPEKDRLSQPKLLASHFQLIAKGTQAFNSYLQEATGYTGVERAFNAMERADDFTAADALYDDGSIAIQQDYDRNLLPSPISRQRRSSANPPGTPQSSSYGRDIVTPINSQTPRRRSAQLQNQPFLSPKSNSPPGPVHGSRSAYMHTTATRVSPPPPTSATSKVKRKDARQNTSRSALVRQDLDHDETGSWSESEEDPGSEGGSNPPGFQEAASDEENDGQDWD